MQLLRINDQIEETNSPGRDTNSVMQLVEQWIKMTLLLLLMKLLDN